MGCTLQKSAHEIQIILNLWVQEFYFSKSDSRSNVILNEIGPEKGSCDDSLKLMHEVFRMFMCHQNPGHSSLRSRNCYHGNAGGDG